MRLGRLLYVDVSIRTSAFPALMGFSVALATYGSADAKSILALTVSLVGVIVVQGLEHAMDVIHDKGGYSAFRSPELEPTARRYIRVFPAIALALVAALAILERPWVIVFGLVAARMAKLYVDSHNEWYAVAGFMSAYAVGYFSATNWPSLPFLLGFTATGFIYKASLSMYRLDDYLDGELPGKEAIIQYYRNIFRYTLHYVPVLVALLIAVSMNPAPLAMVQPYAWAPWIAGFSLMALSMARYRGSYVNQEAPIHYVVAGVAIPDLAAAYMAGPATLAVYSLSYAALSMILYAFWRSRHAMCNIAGCPLNPLLRVGRPK